MKKFRTDNRLHEKFSKIAILVIFRGGIGKIRDKHDTLANFITHVSNVWNRVPSILATFSYQKTGFIIVVDWSENLKNSITNDLSFKTR